MCFARLVCKMMWWDTDHRKSLKTRRNEGTNNRRGLREPTTYAEKFSNEGI